MRRFLMTSALLGSVHKDRLNNWKRLLSSTGSAHHPTTFIHYDPFSRISVEIKQNADPSRLAPLL